MAATSPCESVEESGEADETGRLTVFCSIINAFSKGRPNVTGQRQNAKQRLNLSATPKSMFLPYLLLILISLVPLLFRRFHLMLLRNIGRGKGDEANNTVVMVISPPDHRSAGINVLS